MKGRKSFITIRRGCLGLLLWIGFLALLSCEKVIDVDLEDAEPVLVIEGNISDTETTHYVNISKTVPFSANSTHNPIQGAEVYILDETGNLPPIGEGALESERAFIETRPGVYQIDNYQAYSGRTYTLKVLLDGQEYVASSTMPMPVMIDSVGTVTDSFFGDEEKTIGVVYQDPPAVKNYYRYLVSVNGKPSNLIFAYNDKFNDGKQVQRNLYHEDLDLVKGDAIIVEQQCVDKATYTYFNGIQSNNPGAAAPANPTSNFSNGALGYFSAHTISRAATTIE